MTRRCAYSGTPLGDTEGTLVGGIERSSAAPTPIFACDSCLTLLKLLPLTEHPEGSHGLPQCADGTPVPASGTSPVLVRYGQRAS